MSYTDDYDPDTDEAAAKRASTVSAAMQPKGPDATVGGFDPFAPQVPAVRFGTPNSPEVRNAWDGFLSNPDNQAALIQFGISLMQPMGFGQTPMGHLGQAIGSAGAALG